MHHQEFVPRLSDDHVVLDGHRAEDVPAHLAGEDEETARRFGWWPNHSTADTVLRAYREWSDNWAAGAPRRTFAVRDQVGRLVGGCELRIQPDGETGHVSYWTHACERARGRASHALALLADYAKGLGLTRLESHVEQDNLASTRVSERAGFRYESSYRDDGGRAMVVYARALS